MKIKTPLELEQEKSIKYRKSLDRALVLLGVMVLDDKDMFHKLVVQDFLSRVRVQLKGADKLVKRNKR